jgi:hypothetical protein
LLSYTDAAAFVICSDNRPIVAMGLAGIPRLAFQVLSLTEEQAGVGVEGGATQLAEAGLAAGFVALRDAREALKGL